MEALYRRKLAASPICPICHTHEESIKHLFLLCPWVETIWFGGALNYRVNRSEVTSWRNWLLAVIRANDKSKPDLERVLSLIAFSCWHIWKARCCFLFQHKHINPLQVLSAISTSVGAFLKATQSPSMSAMQHRHGGAGQVSWMPPALPFVKINVDASWDASTGEGFAGAVVRDSFGNFIDARRTKTSAPCVAVAEALALRRGCELGVSLGLTHVVIESDSKESISCMRANISDGRWEAFPVLARCLKLGEAFQDCRWLWKPITANMAADILHK
ncbi:hypothetical protein EV2_039176 [Malus domestica]